MQLNGSTPYEELESGGAADDSSASQLNMRGVFLHVLGDALGSVIVVVNALIFTFVWVPCVPGEPCVNPCAQGHCSDHLHLNHTLVAVDSEGGLDVNASGLFAEEGGVDHAPEVKLAGPCWVLYLDPTLCVIMVCILLYTTYPLLKESALILLQTVPKQIDVGQLSERLRALDGVLAVHELHIWQLAGSRIIATAHIKCQDPTAYMDVAKRIKACFHDAGIHATTVQPEFVTVDSASRASLCELSCRTQCAPKLCCGGPEENNAAGAGNGNDGGKRPVAESSKAVAEATATLEVISESLESAAAGSAGQLQVTPRSEANPPAVFIAKEVESSL